MNFDLSDDHQLIQKTVRDFARNEVAPVAEELDRTKSFPYEIVRQLGELGLMGIPFPEEYGGGGGDTLAYALAVEELTRVDSSVAITLCAHTSLGTQPIYLFGSEQQKREWLPRLCSGERLGAFGLTEPEAGSDAGNLRCFFRGLTLFPCLIQISSPWMIEYLAVSSFCLANFWGSHSSSESKNATHGERA